MLDVDDLAVIREKLVASKVRRPLKSNRLDLQESSEN